MKNSEKSLKMNDSSTLRSSELLKKELDFLELEDRFEMVQLAALDADEKRCNGRCDDAPATPVDAGETTLG